MLTRADARRRWFGAFFLVLAGALLIWGRTYFKAHLTGLGFMLYWLACFALTGLAMLIALWDIRAMRRKFRREQQHLIERALEKHFEEK